jgi:hypothetical protein
MADLIMTVFIVSFTVILTCAAAMILLLLLGQVIDEWEDITSGIKSIWRKKNN